MEFYVSKRFIKWLFKNNLNFRIGITYLKIKVFMKGIIYNYGEKDIL